MPLRLGIALSARSQMKTLQNLDITNSASSCTEAKLLYAIMTGSVELDWGICLVPGWRPNGAIIRQVFMGTVQVDWGYSDCGMRPPGGYGAGPGVAVQPAWRDRSMGGLQL